MTNTPLIGDRQYRLNDGESSFMVDCYGGDTLQIETSKGRVMFSWSDRFGPFPEKPDGSERDLGPKHPFWREASWWNLQSRRIEDGNRAVWHKPKQPVTEPKTGRHRMIIEHGEPGWDW